MCLKLIVGVFGLLAFIFGDFVCAEDLTTKNIVRKDGYPFEEHTVETEDGYLLALHRIPYSPSGEQSSTKQEERPIAFLNHGLLGSSSDWVLLGPGKALAYTLSDAGYDVWLGNARGNRYSRRHVKYDPNIIIGPFWDFSFDEMGKYDLPAMIDCIRNQTGQDELHYLGHSVGTSSFLAMCSRNDKYQSYIKSAHLMTPLVYLQDLSSVVLELGSKVVGVITPVAAVIGNSEFNPKGPAVELAGSAICDQEPRALCKDALFLLDGFNNISVDPSIIDDVLATTPAGSSTKTLLQYFQLHNYEIFQQYDLGLVGNLDKYKSITPPAYPLKNVIAAVFLYYGALDKLVHEEDIDKIADGLGNLKGVRRIEKVDHQYPVYGLNVKEQLYDMMLEDIASI